MATQILCGSGAAAGLVSVSICCGAAVIASVGVTSPIGVRVALRGRVRRLLRAAVSKYNQRSTNLYYNQGCQLRRLNRQLNPRLFPFKILPHGGPFPETKSYKICGSLGLI